MKKSLLTIIFYCGLGCSFAQTSIFDPSFGKNGIVYTDMGAATINQYLYKSQVFIRPDGIYTLIIKSGSFISKISSNGLVDSAYGVNGYSNKVSLDVAYAAFQPDNKIVIVGLSSLAGGIARVNTNGTIDSSFGTNGYQPVNYTPLSVSLQSDGKIVVAGTSLNGGFLVFRYNADGSPDNSFNMQVAQGPDNQARIVAVQPDDKILVGGQGSLDYDVQSNSFLLIRFKANGNLDSSFGINGKQITYFPGQQEKASSIVMQPDGKILISGYITSGNGGLAVARYNINGSLDSSFNGTGEQSAVFESNPSDFFSSMALQPNGKIVIAGAYTSQDGTIGDFVIARYNTNGSADSTFDNDGILFSDILPSADYATSVAIQNGDKILVAGLSYVNKVATGVVARYNENGGVDSSFGSAGKLLGPLNLGLTNFYSSAVQPDGKVIATGTTRIGGDYVFALARYNADGKTDSTFGNNGQQTTDFGGFDYIVSTVVQPDGKIIVAGTNSNQFGLARFTNSGHLDSSFNGNGKALIPTGTGNAVAEGNQALALQADGKIVVTGFAFNAGLDSAYTVTARFNANGSLDNTFSGDGIIFENFGTPNTFGVSTVIQNDGKILISSRSVNQTSNRFALARYNTDGTPDSSFSKDGKLVSDFGAGDFFPNAMAVQPDGEIIVASNSENFILAHYTPNGEPDSSFNNTGFKIISPGTGPRMAISSDGRIAVGNDNFVITIYKSDGTPDSSFNHTGTFNSSLNAQILGVAFNKNNLYAVGFADIIPTVGVVAKYLVGAKSCNCPYVTAANGNWNDPATWVGAVVPGPTEKVTVRHTVSVTVNTTCYSLKVEQPAGNLIITTGHNLTITH